ncbi:PAS domain S-box protein [Uliginosibacterium sp. 31-16]|uniref:PAS domain S-box protein n=1 Tax=Uliginosibacterium sp. 31-16 TaxID=3068315 RepID=UPI00273EB15D|nr:PAS domain S-box protein [Uliginosibacterium sp. 31-16]MDP5238619.1 PAS domain S-box protein [Uliginosibacterium sp. 31-16]
MQFTVRRAVIIAVLLGMLLPAIIAGLVLARFFYSDKLNTEVTRSLEHNTDVIALGVRESLWALDKDSATALVEALMKDPALVSIEVLDPRLGKFVFREAPERREGQIHALERPVLHRGETIGRIRLELSEAPLKQSLQTQLLTSTGVLSLQLIVSVALILFVLQRRVGRPLLRLSDEAAALARGELDKPIQPLRADEIGQVESQLEVTRQALQGLFRTLEQKNRALEVDLRERMRVEAALRDREQRLRTLVEQSPLAVIEFDLGWHILDWNDAAVRIFGWRREEVLGRHASILMSRIQPLPEDSLNQQLDRAITDAHIKLRCGRADQAQIVCQWYNSLIRDSSGAGQRIVAMVEDITERQRSDDEIRRLATVVRLTTNLVALTGADGRIEWFNQAFEERCAGAGESVLGAHLGDVLRGQAGPEGSARIPEFEAAMLNGQMLSGLELSLSSPVGENRWVSLELQPIRGDGEHVLQWVALLTDITDRRAMADALRNLARIDADVESAAFFEDLLLILARGAGAQAAYLATHDKDSFTIQANWTSPGWSIVPGRHPLRGTLGGRVSTDGPLMLKHHAYEAISRDPALFGSTRTEALIIEPIIDSSEHTLGHILMLFENPLSQAAGVQSLIELGAARAATEMLRQRTLQALQHSEQKFFSIFQYAPIPIALLRRSDSICLDLNPSFLAHFGYQRADIIGRTVAETPIYVDLAERQWVLDLLASAGEVSGAEMRLRTHDGDIRDCQIYVRPVTMGEDACLLVATVDVSPLLEAQRQVEELNQSLERRVVERTHALADANAELEKTLERLKRTLDELVRSEKLAALGSLVAGIAHELNTPIGNSLMVASTLRDSNQTFRAELAAGLRRSTLDTHIAESDTAADILMRNLGRAAELISSFKQVAVDQTSSQRRKFDLAEVVGEIIVTMHPVFRKTRFCVDCQIPPGIQLDSYPGPFGQVVANLLNNAILHAFEGRTEGQITLSVEMEGSDHILFHCRDNGIGISPENLRRIFDPFFTTKLGRDGTGLGLNIVHNIITGILGGEVRVSSTLGQGSLFTLHLPLRAPAAEQPPEPLSGSLA